MMMSFESLRGAWQQVEPLPGSASAGAQEARAELEAARARAADLDRDVRRRDLRETAVAFIMVPVFGWLAVTASSPLSALGAGIVVAACLLIPLRLRSAQVRRPDPSQAVLQALRMELDAVRAQERLLASVAWWYFAPLGAGVVLYVIGGARPTVFKVIYLAAVTVLYAWLLHMNRRTVAVDVRPIATDLERWIEDLENEREEMSA